MNKIVVKFIGVLNQLIAFLFLCISGYIYFNQDTWSFYFRLSDKQDLVQYSHILFVITVLHLFFSFLSNSSKFNIPGSGWFSKFFSFFSCIFILPTVYMMGKILFLGREVATAGVGLFVLVRKFKPFQLNEMAKYHLYSKPGGYEFFHSKRYEFIFHKAASEGSWLKLQSWLDEALELHTLYTNNSHPAINGFVIIASAVMFLFYYGARTYRIASHERFEEHMPQPGSFAEFASHFAGQIWVYSAPYSVKGARWFVEAGFSAVKEAAEMRLDEKYGVILESPLPDLPEWLTEGTKAATGALPYLIYTVLFEDKTVIDDEDWEWCLKDFLGKGSMDDLD